MGTLSLSQDYEGFKGKRQIDLKKGEKKQLASAKKSGFRFGSLSLVQQNELIFF